MIARGTTGASCVPMVSTALQRARSRSEREFGQTLDRGRIECAEARRELAEVRVFGELLYEAAHLDGASPWARFWYVTLPSLRPIVLLVCVTAVIRSFQVFTIILAMTQGGPINATRTLVYHLYEQGIQYDEVGYASAAAVVLLVLIGGMTYAQMRLGRRIAG